MDNYTSWSNQTPNVSAPNMAATSTSYTKVILYSILLLSSLLGNVLVIAVVFGNKNLRTNFNHLIVNMAVSDLFIPLLILPYRIVEEMNGTQWLVEGPLGEALCKLCYFLIDISPAVSVFSLVIIAVNRYISIAFPMRSQIFSQKKSCILISITWITSAALFTPYFYIFRLLDNEGVLVCKWTWLPAFDDALASKIYYSIVTAVIFFIPLVAIIMMYSLMAFRIKANSKEIVGMLNDKQARMRRYRNKNIFYVSIVIVLSFVLLWGPYHCLAIVYLSGNVPANFEDLPMVAFVVQFLGYLNSAVNPCIYFIFLRHFRQGLRNLIGGRKRRRYSNEAGSALVSSRRHTACRNDSDKIKMKKISGD